ncbi:mechanosensitive ion channel family protein [Ruegeria sp. HU-ET01832]|uniref:mechanosensitive ion channel family protein n=1 Tax=Ruegeria sp. HU-ET01832 TaxID=3135906 RepID=UPI00333E24F4
MSNPSDVLTAESTQLVLAFAAVVFLLVWRLALLSPHIRNCARVHLWPAAILDMFLLPAGALGLYELTAALSEIGESFYWTRHVLTLSELLVYLAVASSLARLVETWVRYHTYSGHSGQHSHLTLTILYALFWLIGVLVFLAVKDIAPTELYLSTGAVAAVCAFAMQQTLGDFFAGIAVGMERSFKIGDWLRFDDGTEGKVIDINWRSTRLRGWSGGTYVIPNGQLSRQRFLNLHGQNSPYAEVFEVQISNKADPTTIVNLLSDAVGKCSTVMKSPQPSIRLKNGSSQPYIYYAWVFFPNYPSMFQGREELYTNIHEALLNAGLEVSADVYEINSNKVSNKD